MANLLDYHVMSYDWGKNGDVSEVAQLAKNNGINIDNNKQYAELWLGTHPNGPTKFKNGKQFDNLPFLFKILSINKPLSIQTHPDKKTAEKLHSFFPNIYKDDNHKEYKLLLLQYPEFRQIFDDYTVNYQIKHAFESLMKLSKDSIVKYIDMVKASLNKTHIFFRMFDHFAYDVGVLASLLLKYHKLKSGQALFIKPNVIHSYISGTIAECMATSDNVIRAGCTAKYIDKDVLCKTVLYESESQFIEPVLTCKGLIKTYSLSTYPEFKVDKLDLVSGQAINFSPTNDTLCLVYDGKGQIGQNDVKNGNAVFIKKLDNVVISTESNITVWLASKL
jgi:mannose-6-phosphate isomerase